MELTVVVHEESGTLWSEVPELPGCFASGRTLSELSEALAEAIGLYLWDLPAELSEPPAGPGAHRLIASPARPEGGAAG
ncbi:MAG: type II toxin-antitoxin system HicB family antitoxin [Solirubrobacteraceae bacterium]